MCMQVVSFVILDSNSTKVYVSYMCVCFLYLCMQLHMYAAMYVHMYVSMYVAKVKYSLTIL